MSSGTYFHPGVQIFLADRFSFDTGPSGSYLVIIIIIINLDRIAASTRSVGLHAGPQHIRTNKITKQI